MESHDLAVVLVRADPEMRDAAESALDGQAVGDEHGGVGLEEFHGSFRIVIITS